MPKTILVIGAEGKYRNSDVYSWKRMEKEIPLIGDYSDVVIYLPTLNKDIFETPVGGIRVIHEGARKINDALIGNTHIYFIIEPPVQFPNVTSFKLLPFDISYDTESGKTFKYKKTDTLAYLDKISSWQIAFKGNPQRYHTSGVNHQFISLARSNHEKDIAFRIEYTRPNSTAMAGKADILPPIYQKGMPSEEMTIGSLIDCLVPIEDTVIELPERYKQIPLPGEQELSDEDSMLKQTIAESTSRRDEIQSVLKDYELLKGILAHKGIPLEQSVDSALKLLDIDYEPTGTNKEDGNIRFDANHKVPVEIKGHETKGASEKDLRQVIARLSDDTKDEAVRGVLIVNPFFSLPDDERSSKKAFESSVVQQAKVFKIALIDTRILFKYVSDKLEFGNSAIGSLLRVTHGELPYRKPTIPPKQDTDSTT